MRRNRNQMLYRISTSNLQSISKIQYLLNAPLQCCHVERSETSLIIASRLEEIPEILRVTYDDNFAEVIVRVAPNVSAVLQRRCGRCGRLGIIETEHRADSRRIRECLFKNRKPVLALLSVQSCIQKCRPQCFRYPNGVRIRENDDAQLLGWYQTHIRRGAQCKRAGMIQMQQTLLIVAECPPQSVKYL